MRGRWDAKNDPRVRGLHEISGRDYGIKEPYWGPSVVGMGEYKTEVLPQKPFKVTRKFTVTKKFELRC